MKKKPQSKFKVSIFVQNLIQKKMEGNTRSELRSSLKNCIDSSFKAEFLELTRQDERFHSLISQFENIKERYAERIQAIKARFQIKKVFTKLSEGSFSEEEVSQMQHHIRNHDIAVNQAFVKEALNGQLKLMKQYLSSISYGTHQYLLAENTQIRPNKIPNDIPEIDLSTVHHQRILASPDSFSVKIENDGKFYPIFGKDALKNEHYFSVQIVSPGAFSYFAVGLAAANLRNKNSICLSANESILYVNGNKKIQNFKLDSVPVIFVKLMNGKVLFTMKEHPEYEAIIPMDMLNDPLFPVCWIRSFNERSKIAMLKFTKS